MADKPRHLLSGYAAGILNRDEHRDLMEAALADQDVFDQLVEEESWRRIINAPGVRQELREALYQPGPLAKMLGWLRLPTSQLALAGAAAALMAVILVPSLMNSPAVGPEPADSRGLSRSADLVAKGMQPKDVKPLPPMANLRTLSYGVELMGPSGIRPVGDDYRFQAGDEFLVRLEADFPVWVYLLNRVVGEEIYSVVYPQTSDERAVQEGEILVPAMEMLTIDTTPEDERLVLVVATTPWSLMANEPTTIPHQQVEVALQQAEATQASASWRRYVEDQRVHMKIDDPGEGLLFVEHLGAK